MARGRDELEWRRAKETVEYIRAALVEDPWLPAGCMEPYRRRPGKVPSRPAEMTAFLDMLDKQAGKR